MAKIVLEKILSPSEKVQYQFSLGNRYLRIKKTATICFGFLFILGVGIAISLVADISVLLIAITGIILWVILVLFSIFYFDWYLKRANIYLITNRRVIIHKGWLCTNMVSTSFSQITDVKVIEPFIDRLIFKAGILKINTAGGEGHAIILSYIEDPYSIKRKLNELRFFGKEPQQVTSQTPETPQEPTKQKN
jgi:uncharacterized membrane protein YdbT with pleckstrin-like domain